MNTSALLLQGVSHLHPGKSHSSNRLALDDLSLEIKPGEFFVLTGPNGSGKSTLFQIMCGLLHPSAGEVFIEGEPLFKKGKNSRQKMGVVFQHPALDKQLTVMENFRIHADLYGMKRTLFQKRLSDVLSWSGIKDRLSERVGTLSGGQARQVELAKVLLHEPRILLMDEPTTGLDPGVRRHFLQRVQEISRQQKMTVFMNSHLFSEAEQADRAGILKKGRMIAIDPPKQLMQTLGAQMMVVRVREGFSLDTVLKEMSSDITFQTCGQEIRIWGSDLPELFSKLMKHHADKIHGIALKEPTLEDLFIHLTGSIEKQSEEEL